MDSSVFRIAILGGLLLLTALAGSAGGVEAAAPRLIVVQGDLLTEPLYLTDWEANHLITLGIANSQQPDTPTIDGTTLDGRPHLEIMSYWVQWTAELEATRDPIELTNGEPTSRIPFWPAVAEQPAVVGQHLATNSLVEALEAQGVPTRADVADVTDAPAGRGWLGMTVVIAAVVAGLALLVRHRRALAAFRI